MVGFLDSTRRIDAFELWCWRRLLRIPWTARRPNQSIQKEINPYRQSYGFSAIHVWMWEFDHKEGWDWRIDAFKLCCLRRLLRIPWTARRSNQSILKEISPGCSLEGLTLKFQYFGHLMQRADFGKDPDAGKDWKQKEKRVAEDEMVGWHHRFNGQNLRKLWDIVKDREAWGAAAHREVKIEHDLVTEQQQVEASCPTS